MKLSENKKNGFYITLTVFLGVCFVIVVFFIVQHFRNKNTNNCIRKCNEKNCGNDGCKGKCGSCPSGQSCDQDGKCICIPKCDGTCSTNDGCGHVCQGSCPSGQTCGQDGKCSSVTDCYEDNENPFQPPACAQAKKLKCCGTLKFCKNKGDYYCRSNKAIGDVCEDDIDFSFPVCTGTKISDCMSSTQFCPPKTGYKGLVLFDIDGTLASSPLDNNSKVVQACIDNNFAVGICTAGSYPSLQACTKYNWFPKNLYDFILKYGNITFNNVGSSKILMGKTSNLYSTLKNQNAGYLKGFALKQTANALGIINSSCMILCDDDPNFIQNALKYDPNLNIVCSGAACKGDQKYYLNIDDVINAMKKC
jgi:hypothetical protein